MRSLVTGGASGIGRAILERLEGEIVVLDLAEGQDVAEPETWRAVEGPFDVACLNAGVTTGEPDVVALTDGAYRRILRANVDGVVFGVREVAARLMPDGGSIVVTASLAGLTAVPSDPVYALTKHAVVGFVRSVAPQLAERGIRINAVCPGFADTPLLSEEFRTSLGDLPLLSAEEVADAIVMALRSGETGQAWPVQPGRKPEPYRFRGVPGPRGGERA